MCLKKFVNGFATASLLAVSSLVLVATVSHAHLPELASHFRLQYFIIQLLCLGVLVLTRTWRMALLAGFLAVFTILPMLPYWFESKPSSTAEPTLKILQLNVYALNQKYYLTDQLIKVEKPDVIALQEVRPHWATALKEIGKDYPYQVIEPEKTAFGIALLSKIPLKNTKIVHYGKPFSSKKRYFPSIEATVQWQTKPFNLIVSHPLPPLKGFDVRNSQLEDIAKRVKTSEKENWIVAGDLNISPWSPYFQEFLKSSGLRDSQLGFGVQGSWSKFPIAFWRIPIDHVLIDPNFTVLNRKIGPDVGSDHLPVIVELGLREKITR